MEKYGFGLHKTLACLSKRTLNHTDCHGLSSIGLVARFVFTLVLMCSGCSAPDKKQLTLFQKFVKIPLDKPGFPWYNENRNEADMREEVHITLSPTFFRNRAYLFGIEMT